MNVSDLLPFAGSLESSASSVLKLDSSGHSYYPHLTLSSVMNCADAADID
jgi:hypothetical protein